MPRLAHNRSGEMEVFIRVVEPFHQPTGDYVMDPDQVKKIESEHKLAAEAYLKKISAKVSLAGAGIKTEAPFGKAAETLADYATKNQVDLIVIATHGQTGWRRALLGSVTERIIKLTTRPVWIIQPKPPARSSGRSRRWPGSGRSGRRPPPRSAPARPSVPPPRARRTRRGRPPSGSSRGR